MEEMARMIRAQLVTKTASKGKRPLSGRRDVESETDSREQRAANKIATAIEAELKWIPHQFILLSHHQYCNCGQSYRNVVGLFLESKHLESGARRLAPPRDFSRLDRLPHRKEETNQRIAICPHCILERELVEAIMHPIHPCCVQLPLFGHVIQQRSTT